MTKGTYALRNDIYTAAASLRISIKQQCYCLAKAQLILSFKNVNRIYTEADIFLMI